MSIYIYIFFFGEGGGAQKNRLFVTVLLSPHCGCYCIHYSNYVVSL